MRKFLWIAIMILLLAACQNGNDGSSSSQNDEVSDNTVVDETNAPRVEATPVPTATPIPTAMPLPDREFPGHVYAVATRTIHIVEPGDTLTKIASKYQVTIKALSDANRHYDFDLIKVGDALYVPPCE